MTDPLDGGSARPGRARSPTAATSTWCWRGAARRPPPRPRARSRRRGPGTLPFLACLSPGVVVRPTTIVVNKSPIEGDAKVGPITWGAAQLGIAQGVLDAVAEGLIDAAEAAEIVLLVAVWVDPAAADETAVKAANRAAMRDAIADALAARPGRGRARARRRGREARRTPTTRAAERADRRRSRCARYGSTRPAVPRGLGPGPRRRWRRPW